MVTILRICFRHRIQERNAVRMVSWFAQTAFRWLVPSRFSVACQLARRGVGSDLECHLQFKTVPFPFFPFLPVQDSHALSGGLKHVWLVVYLPLWKIWVRQLGLLFPIYGKIKFMFQTTNQMLNPVPCSTHMNAWTSLNPSGSWNKNHCRPDTLW